MTFSSYNSGQLKKTPLKREPNYCFTDDAVRLGLTIRLRVDNSVKVFGFGLTILFRVNFSGGVRFGSESEIVSPVNNVTIFVEPVTIGDSPTSLRGAHASSQTQDYLE
jgi:hypothetical protein